MDIPLNTIRRFNENTFLYDTSAAMSRMYYYANTKQHSLYFIGKRMLFSTKIVYSTLKAFLSNFGSVRWQTDIIEIQIKKERFAIFNRSIYIYGYNSLVPIFVYDREHSEFLIDPLIFYDNKSTLFFMIRKYIIFYIMSKENRKTNIRLITQDELDGLKIITAKRTTNATIELLNQLNISLDAEVKQKTEISQMKQTQSKTDNESNMDYIPF